MTVWWEAMVFLTKSDSGEDEAMARTVGIILILILIVTTVAAIDTIRFPGCNEGFLDKAAPVGD